MVVNLSSILQRQLSKPAYTGVLVTTFAVCASAIVFSALQRPIESQRLGRVVEIWADSWREDNIYTTDEVRAEIVTNTPLSECRSLARAIRERGGFVTCLPNGGQ